MTSTIKATVKSYFQTGDVPTEAQFSTLIDSFPRSFNVSDYGTLGVSIAADTAAFQAAIDAAEGAGGGRVVLDDDVNIGSGGYYPSGGAGGQYQGYYGVNVLSGNIHIVGPGRIIVPEIPTIPLIGAFQAVVFDGGDGACIENVGISGVTIDASALSAGNIVSISGATVSGAVGFYNCAKYHAQRIYVPKGWGYNGVIQTIAGSEYGLIGNCWIITSHAFGVWLDGCYYTEVHGSYFGPTVNGAIHLSLNGDYARDCMYNTVHGNIINCKTNAVTMTGGESNVIASNVIRTNTGFNAFVLQTNSRDGTDYSCEHNLITGNLIQQDYVGGIDVGTVWKLTGNVGYETVVANNDFLGNKVTGKWAKIIDLYDNAQNNIFINNTVRITGGGAFYTDNGSGTITGNITTPNYTLSGIVT